MDVALGPFQARMDAALLGCADHGSLFFLFLLLQVSLFFNINNRISLCRLVMHAFFSLVHRHRTISSCPSAAFSIFSTQLVSLEVSKRGGDPNIVLEGINVVIIQYDVENTGNRIKGDSIS